MVIGRGAWPVRRFALGAEPGDDLSATTTAEERLAMVWELTLEAWALAGWPLPKYGRHNTPIGIRKLEPRTRQGAGG